MENSSGTIPDDSTRPNDSRPNDSRPNEAIIEVSIPMHYFDDADEIVDCAICMHRLCPDDRCSLTATKLTCCDQHLCCGCFHKLLRRCRCTAECQHVVGTCPFCRDMCRSEALSIFLGKQSKCKDCRTK